MKLRPFSRLLILKVINRLKVGHNYLCNMECMAHILPGEQQQPEIKKLNPIGKVPFIVDNGFVLTERYFDPLQCAMLGGFSHPAGDVLWVFVEPGNVVP